MLRQQPASVCTLEKQATSPEDGLADWVLTRDALTWASSDPAAGAMGTGPAASVSLQQPQSAAMGWEQSGSGQACQLEQQVPLEEF